MRSAQTPLSTRAFQFGAALAMLIACSESSDDAGSDNTAGTGGSASGVAGKGGSAGAGATGGTAAASGGTTAATGGTTSATGGTSPATGGMGGSTAGTGATTAGTGGTPASGGTSGSTSTGGSAGASAAGGVAGTPSGGATSGGMGSGGDSGAASGGASGSGGAGTGGTAGKSGTGGSAGGGACQHVQLRGSDICTIGDSWIQIPGNQVTRLQELMRTAGSIGAGENFDRREASGTPIDTIIGTYNRNTECKILIMDGGGIDLFSTPLGPDAQAVTNVVTKFKNFLAKVKMDGNVEHIVYSLYPVIPTTANLNANMKPGFSAACAASEVHCVLVDLEPLFMGQHFASDRTHADNAGGMIIADAWWKAMKENCIGQ